MSLFFQRSSGAGEEQRADTWGSFARGDDTATGGVLQALRVAPVYAAVGLISDSLGMLPMAAYRDQGGVKRRLDLQPKLITAPHHNPGFTRFEWLQQFASSFLLRGNSYGLITGIDSVGTPTNIAWLNPDSVEVRDKGGLPHYRYNGQELDRATVVHVPNQAPPGSVVGLSPISLFQAQIEMAGYASKYGRDWFRNGSAPSGHLKYTQRAITDAQAERARARFKASVANNDIFVSGKDWEWQALAVKPQEAQFLETIKATATTIASIYHVDPEDIGGVNGSSMTYSTLELNQIKFQVRALAPLFTRLELHLSRLLPGGQYVKFNADAIVRTELKTRMDAHAVALDKGIRTSDEVRALEDLPPLTPEERNRWRVDYGKNPTPAPTGGPNDA